MLRTAALMLVASGFGALVVPDAHAATYYVNDASTVGDVAFPGCPVMGAGSAASGCGSCAQPCNHPQLANDSIPLQSGDTVYVNAGTYVGAAGVPILALATKQGTPGGPITFEGPTDARGFARLGAGGLPLAMLDGAGVSVSGISIEGDFLTVRGFGVRNTNCAAAPDYGAGVRTYEKNGAVVGFVVDGNDISVSCPFGSGIDVDDLVPDCQGCAITRNRIHDGPGVDAAVWVQATNGVLVEGNDLSGFRAGLQLVGLDGAVVSHNVVHGNAESGVLLRPCYDAPLCGSVKTSNVRLINNTLVGNDTAAMGRAELSLEGTGSGIEVTNNLLAPAGAPAIVVKSGSSLGRSDFNAFFPTGGGVVGVFVTVTSNTLAQWQTNEALDANSIQTDPLFVSATDVHLRSAFGHSDGMGMFVVDAQSSPLIDRGDPTTPVGQESAPNGGRVEIGAYGGTAEASRSPSALTIVSGDGQSGTTGVPLPQPLIVHVADLQGTPQGAVVLSATAEADAQVTPTGASTDANGNASFVVTPGTGAHAVSVAFANVVGGPAVQSSFTGTASAPDAGSSDGGNTDAGDTDAGNTDGGSTDTGPSRRSLVVALGCGATADGGGTAAGFTLSAVTIAGVFLLRACRTARRRGTQSDSRPITPTRT